MHRDAIAINFIFETASKQCATGEAVNNLNR